MDVVVSVSDADGATDSQSFTIDVRDASAGNDAPEITSTRQRPHGLRFPGLTQFRRSDPNGDTLEYRLAQFPAGMTVNSNGVVEWTPAITDSVSVTLLVSDSRGESAQQTFDVTVETIAQNGAPVITSVPRTQGIHNQLYSL